MKKFHVVLLFILTCFILMGCNKEVKKEPKESYINTVSNITMSNKMDAHFNESDNTITAIKQVSDLPNGSFNEYLIEYLAVNDKNSMNMHDLKENCVKVWNDIKNSLSKFEDVNMNVIVKAIDKESQADIFIVKDGKVVYDAFQNAEKEQIELEKEKKESRIKYSKLINEIENKIPELKVEYISGSEKNNSKLLSISTNLLENIDSTYHVCAELVVKEETNMKNEGITDILITVYNNNKIQGLISFKLENGRYNADYNTVE